MKKILIFILLAVSINGLSQTGFPATQSMATSSTKLLVNGGMQATKGIINGVFTDTTAANADYIDFYNGAQIYTRSDRNFWLRDSVANMWIRMAKFSETGGGGLNWSDTLSTPGLATQYDLTQLATHGIDDVLAVAQQLTTSRTIDANGNTLNIISDAALPLAISRNSASGAGAVDILNINRTGGNGATGTTLNINFLGKNASGSFINLGKSGFRFADATNTSEKTYYKIQGLNAGSVYDLMEVQPGYTLINNLADTVATKAYARSVGGSGGGGTNIYNSDGTLTGARALSLGGNTLSINGTGSNSYSFSPAGITFDIFSSGSRDYSFILGGGTVQLSQIPTGVGASSLMRLQTTYAELNSQHTSGPESFLRVYPDSIRIAAQDGFVTMPSLQQGAGTKALRYNPLTGKITYADTTTGGGGGYTNLTQFVDQNNWKTFYSNGSGDVQELSIGASGTSLTSNGTSSAPSWVAKENTFTETASEFTGSTSMSITLSNTPISGKAEMYFLNGVLINQANISRTGTSVTLSGFTRTESDIITAKFSY